VGWQTEVNESEAPTSNDLQQYRQLLQDAERIRGVSLGRDAWRRLRRNRIAMVSLWGLVVLSLLSALTPFLPLQPPRKVNTALRYAPPRFRPLVQSSLTLSERLAAVPEQLSAAEEQLESARRELREREQRIRSMSSAVLSDADRLNTAREELEEARRRLQDATDSFEQLIESGEADRASSDAAMAEFRAAERALEQARKNFEWTSEEIGWGTANVGWASLLAEKERQQLAEHRQRIADIIQAPYKDEGFGELGPINRLLVWLRLKVFGSWSIGSLLGRDELGRDLLARLFWGARVSLVVGLVATLVSLAIGVSYGAIAGFVGGWVDNLMMRLVDVLYSVPFIFVVIYLITILGQEDISAALEAYGINRITIFFVVVGAIYWLTMARVVRGQVISLKNEQFVEAARTIGASRGRIIFLHVVPNLLSVIIVYLTLTIPRVMLFEAFLSFLGLGVEPPNVSWGLLANDGLKVITPVKIYWWLVVFPGLFLAASLFALNFLGDGLRDALDPRLKNR